MSIGTRVWITVVFLVTTLVAVLGWLRVRDEQEVLLAATIQDRRFFGRALQAALRDVPDPVAWQVEAGLLRGAPLSRPHVEGRIVSLQTGRGSISARLPPHERAAFESGDVAIEVSSGTLTTLIPLPTHGALMEIEEPRDVHRRVASAAAWVAIETSLAFAVLAGLLIRAISDRLVTRPSSFGGGTTPGGQDGASAEETASSAEIDWHDIFADPRLVALIDLAVDNNQELNIAVQEMIVANSEVMARRGDIFPSLSAGLGVGLDRAGTYTSQGQSDERNGLSPDLPDFSLGLYASWEIDIWGRLYVRGGAGPRGGRAGVDRGTPPRARRRSHRAAPAGAERGVRRAPGSPRRVASGRAQRGPTRHGAEARSRGQISALAPRQPAGSSSASRGRR